MLAKQDVQKLLNQAAVKLAGASNAGIKAELYDVLTEFFDISGSWYEILQVDGTAYQTDYVVGVTEGQIIRLGPVYTNSLFTTNALYNAAKLASPGGNLGQFTPVSASMAIVGKVVLSNLPNAPAAMRFVVIKNVTLPTTHDQTPVGPDWVLPLWNRYILDGVLGKMMSTQNKSYTNDTLGTYHLKKFQEGIARARTAALAANTNGAQAWCFPQNFRSQSQRGYLNVSTGNDQRF